jgi:predicted TIM-barrel fold metal-dependent hydrolase
MTIIDVDSHFEIAIRPQDHPLRHLKEFIPTSHQYIAGAVSGDLLRFTPPNDAPPVDVLGTMLNPVNTSSTRFATLEAAPGEPSFEDQSAAERIEWMNRVGIDFALVNPGSIGIMACLFLSDHRRDAFQRSNDFLADWLYGHTDRLSPVALIDWADLDLAVRELHRMRDRGSRAFWIRAEPHGDVAPAHPIWDPVWSAATDLGMIAVLHVGNTPPAFQGWANAGWNQPGGTGVGGFFRYANSMRHQAAEMMLAGMVYGGVFGRHPNLTVMTEELGIGWLPYFVTRCRGLSAAGPWPFETSPGDMARRNIRVAPLRGLGDPDPFEDTFASVRDMLVFCSDFPHGEGNADPIHLLEPSLSSVEPEFRQLFLGGNIADCYARTGDPLTV